MWRVDVKLSILELAVKNKKKTSYKQSQTYIQKAKY